MSEANEMEQKYYDMARIAMKGDLGIADTAEMLIRCGCEYQKSMDIAIEVLYEQMAPQTTSTNGATQ